MIADMDWVLDGPPGVEDLAGYEAEANRLFLTGQALGVCMYSRRAVAPGVRPNGASVAADPDERAGFIGIPRSSGASDILRSSLSGLLRLNMERAFHPNAAEKFGRGNRVTVPGEAPRRAASPRTGGA